MAAASTHGLPVIGTELPNGRDEALEHGRNIYLCLPEDPEILAEAIQLISDNTDLRERLRTGILNLARNWHCWDTMTTRLVAVLESAVAGDTMPGSNQSHFCPANSPNCATKYHSDTAPECDLSLDIQEDCTQLSSPVWSDENTPGSANAPLVSVIVAVYNVKPYLSQCLHSLVNQTLMNIEIIVVNDASTDDSFAILNDYQMRYSNLRVVNCKCNKGLASVRNTGLRLARGKYIGFIDGNDWGDIRMCEVMYRRTNNDHSDVLIADAKIFYEGRKTLATSSISISVGH